MKQQEVCTDNDFEPWHTLALSVIATAMDDLKIEMENEATYRKKIDNYKFIQKFLAKKENHKLKLMWIVINNLILHMGRKEIAKDARDFFAGRNDSTLELMCAAAGLSVKGVRQATLRYGFDSENYKILRRKARPGD